VIGEDRHRDVEYVVAVNKTERVLESFDEALSYAFAAGLNGEKVTVDVLVYSPEGARAFGGDDAVADYDTDPDASVFRRFEMAVRDLGRVS
jgi:hypothetical protein